MRSKRVRRCLVGGAVAALTAVLSPGGWGPPAVALAAAPATAPAPAIAPAPANATAPASATAASAGARAAADAAARGAAFDPGRAYAPGSSQPLRTGDAARLPDAAGDSAAATGSADPNGGSLGVRVTGDVETPQGAALSGALPGGDLVQVHSLGVVDRVRADGSTVWQRSTGSLYRDWHLTYNASGGYVATPQLVFGTDPADPYYVTTASSYAMGNTQPYAIGDLTGDGAADVAVAETVGVNLGAASCGNCGWPFTVPGSDQHYGTFVTVLDGRTGATVYSELDPGFVTQLAVSGKDLVIGDETGSPTGGGPGSWDSVSSVRALSLHRGGATGRPSAFAAANGVGDVQGPLGATEDWHVSTGAQWGLVLGIRPVAGGVAFTWSDTPLGLGDPRPPDGHVVVVDAHGTVRWDHRTAGYPVLSRYDAGRGRLAVVEQTDPAAGVSYTLTGLRVTDGRTVTSARTEGVLPTALTVGALGAHRGASWIVAGVVATADQVSPPYYGFSAATVSAYDPGLARTLWTQRLAAADPDDPPQPGAVQVVPDSRGGATVVVGSWLASVVPSPAQPVVARYDVRGLSGATGAADWDRAGDVADPLSLTAGTGSDAGRGTGSDSGSDSGRGDGTFRGVTDEQDAVTYSAATGTTVRSAPLLADLYAALGADVDGDRHVDDIAGGQSGAVYAFDGRTLTPGDDAPRVLWRADAGGPVHAITSATVAGRPVLAVAATTGLTLLDRRTGRVLHRFALPGQYVWNASAGTVGGHGVVVTATDRVTAFDAATGRTLWTYRPPVAAYFANASVTGGTVVTEYQNQVASRHAPTTMAAVGLDAGTGRAAWTAAADPATTYAAQLPNGVAAGPGIPGAGADGAAFTWTAADGRGRVDVRDAHTGALLYSDTDDTLAGHESYVLDPRVGLVATGDGGSASIGPEGATGSGSVRGTDSGVVPAGGEPVLLTAQIGLNAYPLSALSAGDTAVSPLATYQPFQTGRLTVTPDDRVLTTPIDWRAHQVLVAEAGQTVRAYDVTIEHALASVELTGTPAARAAAQHTQAPKAPAARPSALSLADTTGQDDRDGGRAAQVARDARIATARPAAQVHVRGYSASGTPLLTAAEPSGYDPAAFRAYLGLSGTGAGQTVAVVDAPGDPDITADVDAFSARFGLPAVCAAGDGSGCFRFTVRAAQATGPADPSWGLETAMDVEWVHAVAPDAAVVLVESADGGFASLFRAVDAAAALRPDAISMSWGIPQEFTDETYYDGHCELAASVCSVASGDYGHPGSYPAYDPAVLSVGGTSLHLAGDGSVTAETAWSGSGGGRSYVEPAPSYQRGVLSGGRGTPDISFDADPATGVAVYDSAGVQGQSGWFQVGGTSLGAPAWAAILASADQLRAAAGRSRLAAADASAQKAVYAATAALGDITAGPANGACPVGCSAGDGYDFVTGLGSPRSGLDALLAAAR